jgi:uncharacterized RDD family membrane protein YckC
MARATAVPVSGSKLDNRRVLAALIDIAIIAAGFALILAAAGKLGEPDAGGALTAVGLGWALYYYFACESGDGQTLGKRAMKIRVMRTNGAPAGMREVGLRTILRVIDGLFFYLVGLIVMLATRERRGRLGDLIGGTMIVSAEQPAQAVDMSAPEAPAAVSRVPIAESGPAFEPETATETEVEVEVEQPDVASPSLMELASDVNAVTEDPEREVEEEEPEVELPPAAEAEEAPVAEDEPVAEEEPVAEAEPAVDEPADEPEAEEEPAAEEPADEPVDEEPAAEAEQPESDEEVTVKSVETVSAIDLVMDDQARQS